MRQNKTSSMGLFISILNRVNLLTFSAENYDVSTVCICMDRPVGPFIWCIDGVFLSQAMITFYVQLRFKIHSEQ